MDQPVTVGMIVWPMLAILGVGAVIVGLLIILSIFADAFKD